MPDVVVSRETEAEPLSRTVRRQAAGPTGRVTE